MSTPLDFFCLKLITGGEMTEGHSYIKLMSDIIDSGTWGELSSAARSLYPVLLKFSDQNFKPVWPNTETLMRLTGFKSKKSIIEGKRDLAQKGLIQFKSGTGHSSSKYFFSFAYKNSKIEPQGWKNGYPGGGGGSASEAEKEISMESPGRNPNNINITITNNQKVPYLKEKNSENKLSANSLIDEFGSQIFAIATEKAQAKGLEKNYAYIQAICKSELEKSLKFNQTKKEESPQPIIAPSWEGFLEWAKKYLPNSSINYFRNLDIHFEGRTIFIKGEVPVFQKQILYKFFTEEVTPSILVVFSDSFEKKENRLEYFR
ncbi:MAG: helix-turn-helix domain-containing protein [Leptospiraceae bacterium]|nr:helix-turn-helix domain-containing protein [Leptospiraceae bacterium]MCK6380897.1 helix-turn-helix domain-containing protein [Leptospiraceae bacterium]NUM40048.1 helix-turn-helix domain-containing protein [Leptospiraceae bacterium]